MDFESAPSVNNLNSIVTTIQKHTSNMSTQTDQIPSNTVSSISQPNSPIYFLPKSRSISPICHQNYDGKSYMTIPDQIRIQTFIFNTIYIREKSTCCPKHVENGQLKRSAIDNLKEDVSKSSKDASIQNLYGLCQEMQIELRRYHEMMSNSPRPPLDFNSPFRYTDDDYFCLTGLNKYQFEILTSIIQLRNSENRTISNAIGCLLTKLRLGMSNRVLATFFSFSSKREVGHVIESAKAALLRDFVHKNLGFQHISREDIIQNHTRSLAKKLLLSGRDDAILILDATYIFCQKSSNNVLQRRLFSMHKGRPLVKPMIIVATDGYIVSCIGPYMVDFYNNDASITRHILLNNEEKILDWLCQNDCMIFDRGFRDALDLIKSFGYQVFMPSFLPRVQRQYTSLEANNNLLITVLRWVIEAKILSLVDTTNKFEKLLSDKEFKKIKNRTKIDARDAAPDFPALSEIELQDITIGVFQIKQAKSYSTEHINEDGQYEILVSTDNSNLLRANIQSKHSNRKNYNVIVEYNRKTVTGYCCECPNGNRTVGCCSHVASIMWYLGIA
ncbi:unnamed protein product [Didymodactylos carnosus]|nr:unnamed protein product [Didymodactylos carnosus]CAF3978451.1 unnamed protein product [Didymodactylos carnosus]